MTGEADAAALIQTVQENAKRLGLSWDLTMATVVDGSDAGSISATFDADADTGLATLGLISMIGALAPGARVYVMQVPPAGNYIVGAPVPGKYYARQIVQTLSAAASTIIFYPPPNLRDLTLTFSAAGSQAAAIVDLRMRLNGDASASYSTELLQGNGAAASASLADSAATSAHIAFIAGATSAGNWGAGKVWFPGWDMAPTKRPTWIFESGVISSGGLIHTGMGTWVATPAGGITRLDIVPALGFMAVGSDFILEGNFS